MLVLSISVFLGVFLVVAMLLLAGSKSSQRGKQVHAHLESALANYRPQAKSETIDLRKVEQFSAIPILNHWLRKVGVVSAMRRLLAQAEIKWTPGALLLMCFACFFIPAVLVNMRVHAWMFSLLVGGALGCLPMIFVFYKRKQRFHRFEQRLPDALDLMVSALRAGHSLVAALRMVALEAPEPLASEFRTCYDEQNYGLELRAAMDNLLERVPLQDLKIVMTAILIQKESGGNLAEVLQKATQVIRERFRLRRQVRTHTAQGRLTGMILSLLPIVLGIGLYLVDPKTMSTLWTNPLGIKLLYTAGIMMTLGGLIIRKIVNMEV